MEVTRIPPERPVCTTGWEPLVSVQGLHLRVRFWVETTITQHKTFWVSECLCNLASHFI